MCIEWLVCSDRNVNLLSFSLISSEFGTCLALFIHPPIIYCIPIMYVPEITQIVERIEKRWMRHNSHLLLTLHSSGGKTFTECACVGGGWRGSRKKPPFTTETMQQLHSDAHIQFTACEKLSLDSLEPPTPPQHTSKLQGDTVSCLTLEYYISY